MADLHAIVAAMPDEQREGACIVLDAISRPLTAREIETTLRYRGVPRARAIKLAGELKRWHILAMVGPEA